MEAWGGNDDWDFEFEPEILKQQPVKVAESEQFLIHYGHHNMVVVMKMMMKMLMMMMMIQQPVKVAGNHLFIIVTMKMMLVNSLQFCKC